MVAFALHYRYLVRVCDALAVARRCSFKKMKRQQAASRHVCCGAPAKPTLRNIFLGVEKCLLFFGLLSSFCRRVVVVVVSLSFLSVCQSKCDVDDL